MNIVKVQNIYTTPLNGRYLQSMKLHENKISKADTCISIIPYHGRELTLLPP